MYFLIDSPTIVTNVPDEEECVFAASSDERFIAVCIHNQIYFHCQKTFALLGCFKWPQRVRNKVGDIVDLILNEFSTDLLVRTSLGFVVLVNLVVTDCDAHDTGPSTPYTVTISGLRLLKQFSEVICCVATNRKIILSTKTGRICGLNWSGDLIPDEDINIHNIGIFLDLENATVANYVGPAVHCTSLFWAPTLGGLVALLTDGRLALLLLPFLQLNIMEIKAIWVANVCSPAAVSVNNRFQSITIGDLSGSVVAYRFDESSKSMVVNQTFQLPDPVKHGLEKVPGAVKSMSWSPDGFCLAVSWQTHGFALWSVFGALLYTSLLDQIEVTRFLNPLSFCWTFKAFHLWMWVSFMDDPDRKARTENLAAFRERLQQSKSTESAKAKASKKRNQRRSDGRLSSQSSISSTDSITDAEDGESQGDAYLMVFKIAKSALVANPTTENHLHTLICTPDSVLLAVRRVLHSCRNLLTLPLPLVYARVNTPVKFASLNAPGTYLAVAGRRGFALCLLSTLNWKVFGNVTQEQSFEVYAGLAWWYKFVCFSAFNYTTNRCEIRCYPSSEKLDDRFVSSLPLEASVRPLFLDVVGNQILYFSTDSHYRSLLLVPGQRNWEVSIMAHLTINLIDFFPVASCLTRICPFSLQKQTPPAGRASLGSNSPSSPTVEIVGTERELEANISVLVTYAGNLLFFPQLSQVADEKKSSSFTYFFGFGSREANSKKYSDTYVPTLITSNVEFMWLCANTTPAPSFPIADLLPEDSEDEDYEEGGFGGASGSASISALSIPLLNDSVWIHCGSHGLKIWFPLSYHDVGRTSEFGPSPSAGFRRSSNVESQAVDTSSRAYFSFTSKGSRRVMLSLRLDGLVFPLSILLEKAVVITAQNGYIRTDRSYSDTLSDRCIQMPWSCIQLKTNLFLPHLLKDLLSKNLSSIAHDLADAYQSLTYFQHILELLLHEVLEEEATSNYPIPDPLLPQVTAFIEQFPQFLDVVVQCTRKTEVTWWRHLYFALGRRPKDVFDHAVSLGQLDTAASCLVILQNTEVLPTVKQCALVLLRNTMELRQWNLVNDLMRFLKATSMPSKSPGLLVAKKELPGSVQGEADPFNEVDMFVERTKLRLLKEGEWRSLEEHFANLPVPPTPSNLVPLLNNFQDLSTFDLIVPQWILRNREHVPEISNWQHALMKLHAEFEWFLSLGQSRPRRSTCIKQSSLPSDDTPQPRVSFSEAPILNLGELTRSLPVLDDSKVKVEPSFSQASRSYRQLDMLLTHLLWVAHEISSLSIQPLSCVHNTALSWCVLVSLLMLDERRLFAALALIQSDRNLMEPLSCWLKTGRLADASSSLRLPRILQGLDSLETWFTTRNATDYIKFCLEIKPKLQAFVTTFVLRCAPTCAVGEYATATVKPCSSTTAMVTLSPPSSALTLIPSETQEVSAPNASSSQSHNSQGKVPVNSNGFPAGSGSKRNHQPTQKRVVSSSNSHAKPSVKPIRGQHRLDSEFETTSDRHLVNADSGDDSNALCSIS